MIEIESKTMGAELTSIKVNGVQKLFQGERVKKKMEKFIGGDKLLYCFL